MEKLDTYSNYKPSGVEWIGEIPKGWKLERTKWVYSESKERNREFKYQDEDLLSVSEYYGVAKRAEKIDNNDILNRAESLSENKAVKKGELVINIMLAWKKGLGSSNFEGIVSPSYCVYRLKNANDEPRYFHYLYRTDLYAELFRRFSRGIIESRLRLYTEEFFNILTIVPLPEEQTAIANFLDDKTAKIDLLIGKKKKLIEFLKEERAAVINEAVTKGIDPNVKLKDSGIEWLGDIPEHWEVKKLKYVAKIFGRIGYRGYTISDMVNEGEGAITISPSNMKDWLTDFSNCSFISWSKYEESPEIKVYNSDIVFVKTGSTFGKTAMIQNLPQEATINPQLIVFKNIKCNPNHFLYLFQSTIVQDQVKTSVIGGTIPTISQEKIYNYVLLIPPPQDQFQIVQYIETETKRIDSAISKIEKEIELLAEYRTALISEVVTGKIKVT